MNFSRLVITVLSISLLSSCEKYQTDASSGREFLLRYSSEIQQFEPGITEFTGEHGMSFVVQGPFTSLESGDTIEGSPQCYLREYPTAKSMYYARVETRCNGQMLATSGAFRLAVKIGDQYVQPNLIQFSVPSNVRNDDTELFYGKTDSADYWLTIPYDFIFPTALVGWVDTSLFNNPQSGYGGYIYPQTYYYDNGWLSINCDRFYGTGLELTNIIIRPSASVEMTSLQMSVAILFQSEDSYIEGYWTPSNSGYSFQNVPIGYEVVGIGIGVSNNQDLYFGMLEFTIQENGVYTFEMNPISEEDLESILEGL